MPHVRLPIPDLHEWFEVNEHLLEKVRQSTQEGYEPWVNTRKRATLPQFNIKLSPNVSQEDFSNLPPKLDSDDSSSVYDLPSHIKKEHSERLGRKVTWKDDLVTPAVGGKRTLLRESSDTMAKMEFKKMTPEQKTKSLMVAKTHTKALLKD